MKQAMIEYKQKVLNDEYYTPPEAVYPLLKYLPKNKVYWECTDFGNSNITKILEDKGYKVVSTGRLKDSFDFLVDEPKFSFDIIITNPPYSLKTDFLKRCYMLDKPFALLLPIHTLEGIERGKLFRKYEIELLVFDRRINFDKTKKRPWFAVGWFCWNILPEKLIFAQVLKGV